MNETIKLKHPIECEGRTLSELTMRRVTVGDLEVMDKEKTDIARAARLTSLVADIPPEAVRNLDAQDFSLVQERLMDFLG